MRQMGWRGAHRDERGVAMVTALLASVAVLTISILAVELSVHNLDQSSRDRKRVQSIDVAESGIDAFESALRFPPGGSIQVPCPATPGATGDPGANLYGDLSTAPPAHYAVRASFYSVWPPTSTSTLTCSQVTGGVIPAAILIKSEGTAVRPGTGRPVTRTMETLVRVTPEFGVLNLAIFSDTGLGLNNQLTVNGHASNDADVYTNGSFTLNNNTSIGGSVLAQGNITIGQGIVKADTWSGGNTSLSSGVAVSGNATAAGTLSGSQGSISLNNSTVYGNAKAKGGITLSNNSVVNGTKTPNATGVAPPPAQTLPHLCWPGCTGDIPPNGFQLSFTSSDQNYNTTCLQPSGCIVYTERDYSGSGTSACASAKSDIGNWFGASSGNYIVVINAACPLQWGNQSTVDLKGHLAIISFGGGANCGANANIHGAICTVNNVTYNSVGGTWNMILIRPWQSGLNCSTGDYDITLSNSTLLNGLKTFIYSQCVVNFGNNNASGVNTQLIGGTVNITNQMVLNFDPILSPNVKISAYNLGPAYLREIANGT